MGAFSLTKLLLPLLRSSPVPSRIVNVSSFTHLNGEYRLIWYLGKIIEGGFDTLTVSSIQSLLQKDGLAFCLAFRVSTTAPLGCGLVISLSFPLGNVKGSSQDWVNSSLWSRLGFLLPKSEKLQTYQICLSCNVMELVPTCSQYVTQAVEWVSLFDIYIQHSNCYN